MRGTGLFQKTFSTSRTLSRIRMSPLAVFAFALLAGQGALAYQLPAVGDTFVDSANASQSFGALPQLAGRRERESISAVRPFGAAGKYL